MVLMDQDVLIGKNHSEAMGFDALSSYGINGGGTVEVNTFSLCEMPIFLSQGFTIQ